tara:strand:+ start:146 stop:1225 length:1080 start_codon:yes stop_codon:yes gene_type:complete
MKWESLYPEESNLVKLSIENGGFIKPLIIPDKFTNGTGLCNPCVYLDKEEGLLVNIRHVGYVMHHVEFNQHYWGLWGAMQYMNPEDFCFLETNNYLCKLNDKLDIISYSKINTSKFDKKPLWDFIGQEDVRIFRWDDILYTCGVRRDIDTIGTGRMEMCKITYNSDNTKEGDYTIVYKDSESVDEITRDRIEVPEIENYLEKNWMPVLDMPYHFIRHADPAELVKVDCDNKSCDVVIKKDKSNKIANTKLNNCDLRGGSQVIPFGEYRLCITHECFFPWHPVGNGKDAHYYHRFLFYDKDWNIVKISKRFKFMDAMIEFNCGMAERGDDLLITFGYQDNAAYILSMPKSVLDKIEYEEL